MNKQLLSIVGLFLLFVSHDLKAQDWASFVDTKDQNWAQFVDPMIGTGGVGHTYPGATVPFGMVQLSPDTRRDGSWEGCAGYFYPDSLIYGFSHTHLSGTGCSDYGDVLTIPCNEDVNFKPEIYASTYSHTSEVATPGYYAVTLADNNIRCEMTTTTRSGMQRYSYPKEINPTILLDLVHRDFVLTSTIKIVSNNRIEGSRRSEAWARSQIVHFSMEFSQPIEKIVVEGKEKPFVVGDSLESKSIRLAIYFKKTKSNVILVRSGISTVSEANAHLNVVKENDSWDFDKVQSHARAAWNSELGKIAVSGGNKKSLTN
ncbi:MAG TPA: glycoside hydrolase family 92 protein, partial [Bacteroidia bacterium]|nr:glycoside hydrolase family 92 protein [Bacteroidia bacterium]